MDTVGLDVVGLRPETALERPGAIDLEILVERVGRVQNGLALHQYRRAVRVKEILRNQIEAVRIFERRVDRPQRIWVQCLLRRAIGEETVDDEMNIVAQVVTPGDVELLTLQADRQIGMEGQ